MSRPAPCLAVADLPEPPPGKTGWPWTEAGRPPAGDWASETDLPVVAVVTPSFQQAEFLEETIRSVLLQGYPKLRYAIMDGGSTDGSVDIIRKYEPWLDYWVTGPDGGQAKAIDEGLGRIDGEILAWLNSDDVFAPGAVWKAAREFGRNPAATLVYGNADEIARDGTPLGPAGYVRQADRPYLVQVANAIAQPSAYFRRAAYEAAGRLDHGLFWTMDYDLWIRLADRGPLVYIPETLSRLRVYPEAKTSLGLPGMFDEFRAVGERYGGYGQFNQIAVWMVPLLLPKSMAALRRGDLSHGLAWLTSVIANDPAWRSEPRLVERLAGEAWLKICDANEDTHTTLRWAQEICRGLPERFVSPKAVEQRVIGLLYEALAFRSYAQKNASQTLRYAARAVVEDRGRAANRGLWSITVRSLVRLLA